MSLPSSPASTEQMPVGLTQHLNRSLHLPTQMVRSTKTWGTAVFVRGQSPFLCTFESNYCISIVLLPNNLKCVFLYLLLQFLCRCCLITKSYQILCEPVDCSPPASSVHAIAQAKILEWVAICFFRESSLPRD